MLPANRCEVHREKHPHTLHLRGEQHPEHGSVRRLHQLEELPLALIDSQVLLVELLLPARIPPKTAQTCFVLGRT